MKRIVTVVTRLLDSNKRGEIFLPVYLKTYRGVAYMYLNQIELAQQDLMPQLGNQTVESSFNSNKSIDDQEEFYN